MAHGRGAGRARDHRAGPGRHRACGGLGLWHRGNLVPGARDGHVAELSRMCRSGCSAGFFFERLEVCFLHGAFVALPFFLLARGGPMWLGCIAGVVLHFLLNFPIYLAQIDLFGLGSATWVSVLILWIVGFVVFCALMLRALARHHASAPPRA